MVVWVAVKYNIPDTEDGYGWTYVAATKKEVMRFLAGLEGDKKNWTVSKRRDYYSGA